MSNCGLDRTRFILHSKFYLLLKFKVECLLLLPLVHEIPFLALVASLASFPMGTDGLFRWIGGAFSMKLTT